MYFFFKIYVKKYQVFSVIKATKEAVIPKKTVKK